MNSSRLAAVATMMAAVATAAALTACGGGGGSTTPPGPPPAAVGSAGIYAVDYGQFSGVYTLLDNNEFSGVHFVSGGSVLAGHPHGLLSATNSTSARDPIAWANLIDDANQWGAQELSGVFGRTFSGGALNVSITGSMGSFTATAKGQAGYDDGSGKTLYGDPIPLSVAAGTYNGGMRSVGLSKPQQGVTGLTLDAAGNLAATVGACTFTGTLVQHGTTGVYDARVGTSGSGCGFVPSLGGLATPLAYGGGKPTWALQLDSADNMQTAVFIVTKQ